MLLIQISNITAAKYCHHYYKLLQLIKAQMPQIPVASLLKFPTCETSLYHLRSNKVK